MPFLTERITEELKESYPGIKVDADLPTTLINAVNRAGNKFIMIIDEWDAPIRELPEIQEAYLKFLRSLFKNSGVTSRVFAAAYMTGILPIKKDGSQSAISDINEYTMLGPLQFAEYVGFTEEEFANDLITFRNRDDVLTLLVHLGYLAYDERTGKAHIPNEEIRLEFSRTIRADRRPDTIKRVQDSDRLIMDTIHMNAEAVAAQIEKVHVEATNPLNANNEQSLRAVIQLAYFSYKDYYLKMEELPTGYGYADIVYLPRPGELLPALVIELKWNHSADTAIEQIRQRRYPEVLQG